MKQESSQKWFCLTSRQILPCLLVLKLQYAKCKKILGALQAWQRVQSLGTVMLTCSAFSLSSSVVFLLGTLSIVYPCPVFAQLPSTGQSRLLLEHLQDGVCICSLFIVEEVETSGRHRHAHTTYLSRISICFLQIQKPHRNFKRRSALIRIPCHLRSRALLITSNCPHPPQFQHSYHPALL